MSRSRQQTRAGRELKQARATVADEFEPLWRPAPYVPFRRGLDALERINIQECAKRTAIAWLSDRMGRKLNSIEQLDTLEECRRAFVLIRKATLLTVRAWADRQEQSAWPSITA